MKKIENIVDNCIDCRFAQAVYSSDAGRSTARLCTHVNPPRFAGFDGDGAIIFVPDWCPLGMNKEVEQSEAQLAAAAATPSTIILPGLPHLEWMTENLSGFGGTEVDGRTYYTYDEAVAAVEQLSDGWRLSTTEEWEILDRLGSVWQDGPHGLPGRLFGGGLFLEAAGWSHRGSGILTSVGESGNYWSLPDASNINKGHLFFYSSGVHPLSGPRCAHGFSVRCVRNVK